MTCKPSFANLRSHAPAPEPEVTPAETNGPASR